MYGFQAEAASEVKEKQAKSQKKILQGADLSEFTIRGNEDDWQSALAGQGGKGLISVKG